MARRGQCLALSRIEGLAALTKGEAMCVDTFRNAQPGMVNFAPFCPFTVWPECPFPVPGMLGRRGNSVEGIWQGLKLVDGQTDLAQLDGIPRKRPPDHEREGGFDYRASTFRYGTREIDLVTARLLIYLPIYLHLLDRIVPAALLDNLYAALNQGKTILFYDWDHNMDIGNDGSSFSHSSLLAAWFGGRLEPLLDRWSDRELEMTGNRPTIRLSRYRQGCGHA